MTMVTNRVGQCSSFQESFSLSPLFILHSTLLIPRKDNQKSGLQLELKSQSQRIVLVVASPQPLASIDPEYGSFWWKLYPKFPTPSLSKSCCISESQPNNDPYLTDAQDHSHGALKLSPSENRRDFPVFLSRLFYGAGLKIIQEFFIH